VTMGTLIMEVNHPLTAYIAKLNIDLSLKKTNPELKFNRKRYFLMLFKLRAEDV